MKKIFCAFIVFLSSISFCQKVTQSNVWVMYTGNHRLSEKWGLHTEYQWRRSGFFQDWQQSLTRIGVDYYSKSGIQLSTGYAWILTFPYGKQPVSYDFSEHRIWQQLIMKNKFSRIDIQHRYRFEQRFLQLKQQNSSSEFENYGYIFRQRCRYRLMLNIPLNRKEMTDKTLFLNLSDEIFLGFGKGIGKNILDQNRVSVGFGWSFSTLCNIQLGYLNQYLVKSDGVKIERNHTLLLGITYSMDFRKQQ